jgi:hypothetical protein
MSAFQQIYTPLVWKIHAPVQQIYTPLLWKIHAPLLFTIAYRDCTEYQHVELYCQIIAPSSLESWMF